MTNTNTHTTNTHKHNPTHKNTNKHITIIYTNNNIKQQNGADDGNETKHRQTQTTTNTINTIKTNTHNKCTPTTTNAGKQRNYYINQTKQIHQTNKHTQQQHNEHTSFCFKQN